MTPEYQARLEEIADIKMRRTMAKQIMRITEEVARSIGVTARDIVSHSRQPHLVSARDLIAFEARVQGCTLQQIGRAMNRDHSSIHDAIRREAKRRAVKQ